MGNDANMTEVLDILNKNFPEMECAIVFERHPETGQLFMNPVMRLPENKNQEFLLAQSNKFIEYARGCMALSQEFHRIKFK